MKREEYDEIIRLLDSIQEVAYYKYTNAYMPSFNALGGSKMDPIYPPVYLAGRNPLICLDEAIQMTNILFVYHLDHSIMLRSKMVQNQPFGRTAFQKEIDGVNYMTDMTNEMTKRRGLPNRLQISDLSYNDTYKDLIAILQSILGELQKL